jgi:hypothetical protein
MKQLLVDIEATVIRHKTERSTASISVHDNKNLTQNYYQLSTCNLPRLTL